MPHFCYYWMAVWSSPFLYVIELPSANCSVLKGNICIYAFLLTHTAFRFRILRCLLAYGEKYWETFPTYCRNAYTMPYHTILVIMINFISFNCFNYLNWDLSPLDYCWFDYTKTWMFLYFKKNKIFAAVLHFIRIMPSLFKLRHQNFFYTKFVFAFTIAAKLLWFIFCFI